MPLLHLIILAIVQGLTEFLPISSSAHLILVPYIMHWQDQGALIDVAAHFGSLGAVLLYFRKDSMRLLRGGIDTITFKPSDDRKLFLFLAIATLPLLIFGAIIAALDLIEPLRSPMPIGIASIVFGLALWWSDRRPVTHEKAPNRWKSVMIIGAAQMLALIPGTSRSGITMTAARGLGFSREQSARFSMLLAIPAILALSAYAFYDLLKSDAPGALSDAAIVAILSFIAAYGAISLFLKWVSKIGFFPFVLYRLVLGVILIAFALSS